MAKLPVLMYHNFTLDVTKSSGLTISAEKFEQQLNYLTKNNYQFLWSSDLESLEKNSKKSVVLTFDDVTQNQMDIALPLLKKYQVKATFFVPFAYLGATDLWNKGKDYQNQKIMTAEQLQSLDANLIQLAHHSYKHCKYSEMSVGWNMVLLDGMDQDTVATLLGTDRTEDFGESELEHPDCLAVIWPSENVEDGASFVKFEHSTVPLFLDVAMVKEVASGTWYGKANRLSREHGVYWDIIDEAAKASCESTS